MARTSLYTKAILEDLTPAERQDIDPRWVEGYMRLEHSTLDQLSRPRFRAEVRLAVECVRYAGREQAEDCARSFGL